MVLTAYKASVAQLNSALSGRFKMHLLVAAGARHTAFYPPCNMCHDSRCSLYLVRFGCRSGAHEDRNVKTRGAEVCGPATAGLTTQAVAAKHTEGVACTLLSTIGDLQSSG
jgi:hypothetical protein